MLSVLSKVNSESFCRTRLKLRYRTSIQVMFLLLPNSSSYDILDIKSSVKFPHVARRRDGDNKAAREIDDIISLFTCFDENILFDYMFLVTLMRCHLPGSMREICMVFSNY